MLALSLAPLGGCFVWLDHELPQDAQAEVVVTAEDFTGSSRWPRAVVGTAPNAEPHEAAERTAFINALPADDDDAFPLGTIIVKTGSGGEATGTAGHEVHAMVKRGGTFNSAPDAAHQWEWMELVPSPLDDDAFVIAWRGAEPPAGENYGCPPGQVCGGTSVTCNQCHVHSAGNDYVQSTALTLGAFDVEEGQP